jgi:hypothetical protein
MCLILIYVVVFLFGGIGGFLTGWWWTRRQRRKYGVVIPAGTAVTDTKARVTFYTDKDVRF